VEGYAYNFSFLYDVKKLKEMNKDNLKMQCVDLHIALSDGDSHDINGLDLFSELRVLREIILEGTDAAFQGLQYLKSPDTSFPNTETAYRILLTVPVTAASGEKFFEIVNN
jgi:hypothetical protein